MDNVISMPVRNVPEPQGNPEGPQRTFDLTFGVGLVATVILPQFILSSYFGALLAVTLTAGALVGIGLGLGIYRRFPFQSLSCIPKAQPQSSIHDISCRKAA